MFNLPMKTTGKLYLALIPCCCVVLSLSACGQTGPLYLPDKEDQTVAADTAPVSEQTAEQEIEENDNNR
jgi:predicted small lipoprotein YifL